MYIYIIMGSLLSILIFIVIFFIYLHLIDQFKTSNDLELYEMDFSTPTELNETCNIKQPIVFQYKHINEEFFQVLTNETLENIKENILITDNNQEQLILECSSACVLLNNESKNDYYTENNDLFIYESNLQNLYEKNDQYLKPPFTIKTKYDIHIATDKCKTPLRYHTYHRNYFIVHSGKLRVKLIPPKYKQFLDEIKDYDNYSFYSPINLWDIQKKYAQVLDKIQLLEFDIYPGNILYIPPNWWYSMQFIHDDDTPCVCSSITYITAMNALANTKHYLLYFIQQSNTQLIKTKTINQTELNKQSEQSTSTQEIRIEKDNNIDDEQEQEQETITQIEGTTPLPQSTSSSI